VYFHVEVIISGKMPNKNSRDICKKNIPPHKTTSADSPAVGLFLSFRPIALEGKDAHDFGGPVMAN